ncbi:MAG: SAM-dependent methyltransferase, partial [Saprospiraceae bacterium]
KSQRTPRAPLLLLCPPAATALEINCGTGEDAIWMAQQGWQVLATDASAEMVAVAKAKIEQAGLTEKVSARVCSFAEVGQLQEGGFDLIFSNFGGLNCVSPEELRNLGAVFFQKLKPGGKLVAVVMGRFCWWETLYYLLKMKPREAFRRLRRNAVEVRLAAQTTVPTWYYWPSEFQKTLHSRIQSPMAQRLARPIGLWLPPSYLNPFFEKRPRLLRFLNFLEKTIAPSWLAFAADHFLICIQKRA